MLLARRGLDHLPQRLRQQVQLLVYLQPMLLIDSHESHTPKQTHRFTAEQLQAWRSEGGVLLERFFHAG